ncbi:hypothetical protein FHS04_000815 [Mesoflavibacter sabulilitoris]|uniref:THIF-type NAD/FAD binding fold domain-containing protein n=1 Tax=Mesoflavibacter zeaxanthinifaciens subsp. sabulilitoris TaxID=1520893 RepID=A0A2T1N619_9FLAO|nr:ThiF family adenylyltransferase [Mesoflavibacter zeaxanthinifaciens]MBB3123318.1 hypothetical protein [Mesoflavibacter zeaxanthinifaciens subsp. sabulilitoris]PSG87046.1 hypothetical protein C7H61_13125 [Mesoflavibacter zeaxanthinifaciens subsp. sabulilitoris]
MNYSRITDSVDISLLQHTHIVVVGAGGSKQLILNLARTGIGALTVLDIDKVDATNIVRQGYDQADIGKYKVEALRDKIKRINPNTAYTGITKDFLSMTVKELDAVFKDADMFLFLTDAFKAQSYGNILALKYLKPALWAGWYAKSRTAEVFFQIPQFTPACFRCAVSSRYHIQEKETISVSSECNTIFHSALLDSYIGFLILGILHKGASDQTKESAAFFKGLLNDNGHLDWNFFQLKVHPDGGNPLFDKLFDSMGKSAHNFTSCWQRIEPELIPKYDYDCPDCKGVLLKLINSNSNE